MNVYVIPTIVAASLLSACSSSNPSNQLEDAIGFVATLDAGEVQEVNVDDLPDNATMNGYLAVSNSSMNGDRVESSVTEDGTVYLGDATADFNFANNTLSGTASNFNEYQLSENCLEALEECTGEQTRALNGSLNIIGGIDDTSFYYDASGQLTTQDDELGNLTANVYLGGEGQIGTLDDKLVAVGDGGGSADLFDEDGYLGTGYLQNILILQE